MSGSKIPKLWNAMNLSTSDTSNITHYQIQSAMELRLESMDGEPRTMHSSVSSLPSPVRDTVYSDPGNVLLAEKLRLNDRYLAKILTFRAKSAPTGLLHPSMGINRRSQSDPSYSRSTVSAKPALVRTRAKAVTMSDPLHSHTQPHTRRTTCEKSVSLNCNKTSDHVIFVRTNPEHLSNVSCSSPRQVHTSQNNTRPVHSPVRRRAVSCRSRTYPATPRLNYTVTRRARSVSVSADCLARASLSNRATVTWAHGHSLNSKRAEDMAWSRDKSKSSQGLSLSNICRALPISYSNFLVETVAPLT